MCLCAVCMHNSTVEDVCNVHLHIRWWQDSVCIQCVCPSIQMVSGLYGYSVCVPPSRQCQACLCILTIVHNARVAASQNTADFLHKREGVILQSYSNTMNNQGTTKIYWYRQTISSYPCLELTCFHKHSTFFVWQVLLNSLIYLYVLKNSVPFWISGFHVMSLLVFRK